MGLKKIEAIIWPEKLGNVRKALERAGVYGMTVVPAYARG